MKKGLSPKRIFTATRVEKTKRFVLQSSKDPWIFGKVGSRSWIKQSIDDELDEVEVVRPINVMQWMKRHPDVFKPPQQKRRQGGSKVKATLGSPETTDEGNASTTNEDDSLSAESDASNSSQESLSNSVSSEYSPVLSASMDLSDADDELESSSTSSSQVLDEDNPPAQDQQTEEQRFIATARNAGFQVSTRDGRRKIRFAFDVAFTLPRDQVQDQAVPEGDSMQVFRTFGEACHAVSQLFFNGEDIMD